MDWTKEKETDKKKGWVNNGNNREEGRSEKKRG